jgi:IS5 family transposase
VEAAAVLRNGYRALRRVGNGRMRGRMRRALAELAATIARTRRIAAQARTRLAGQTPDGASRLISLQDPEARPIRKRRLDRPVEFGYKAQVLDTTTRLSSWTTRPNPVLPLVVSLSPPLA